MTIPIDRSLDEESVTVIVSRRVKLGKEKEFEEWAAGIAREAQQFEGYLGTKNIQPSNNTKSNSVVIIKFDRYKNLKKWEDSSIRAEWINRAIHFTEGDVQVHKLTGLEYWFTLPKTSLQTPPPRYKMAIITFLALFPAIKLVDLIANVLLGTLQATFRLAISTMVTVSLMTYVIMPMMTRLFKPWLFKPYK
jgi:uncharacterized protein